MLLVNRHLPAIRPRSSRPKTEEPIVEALFDDLGDFDLLGVGMFGV
jgi:hypothetical protein